MTGIIINDGEQYYTDLKDVLTIMGDSYKDYEEKAVLSAGIPYADGNSAIWTNPVRRV